MWAAIRHTYWDWVSMLMLMLLELIIYFVPNCFPHVIAFLFYFFHTRKVSERDPLRSLPKDVCLYYPRRNHV